MSDDIKIYVAHSPNSHMERIDAPFFYNVIAGSDLQEGTFPEDMTADNTGDNISRKNRKYCELTVQYWAWKNEQADYWSTGNANEGATNEIENGNEKSNEASY